ncbi:MAG: hypothetical protein ACOC2W_04225 [bacterium]
MTTKENSMNKSINEKFKKIEDYFIKAVNNFEENRIEFEIGFPEKWYYKSNDIIKCEEDNVEGVGKILKIYPQEEGYYIEDTINFIIKTIETNNRISEMEKSFKEKMESEKEKIQKEVDNFYSQIEELREKSFDNIDDDEQIDQNLDKIKEISETYDGKNNVDEDETELNDKQETFNGMMEDLDKENSQDKKNNKKTAKNGFNEKSKDK